MTVDQRLTKFVFIFFSAHRLRVVRGAIGSDRDASDGDRGGALGGSGFLLFPKTREEATQAREAQQNDSALRSSRTTERPRVAEILQKPTVSPPSLGASEN